jgi:hypothetical protein
MVLYSIRQEHSCSQRRKPQTSLVPIPNLSLICCFYYLCCKLFLSAWCIEQFSTSPQQILIILLLRTVSSFSGTLEWQSLILFLQSKVDLLHPVRFMREKGVLSRKLCLTHVLNIAQKKQQKQKKSIIEGITVCMILIIRVNCGIQGPQITWLFK